MDSIPVLKTIDGGLTWQEKIWSIPLWFEQGIGFVNDSLGWCGSAQNQVKETTDGGNSWNVVPFVQNFNRFRRINDTLAYASGNRIWKYSNQIVGIKDLSNHSGVLLEQNYPNPFSDKTMIKYYLPKNGQVILKVYDLAGRPVKTLINARQNEGEHQVELDLAYHYDTYFYYTLSFENVFLTKKAIMVRKKN